MGEKRDIPTGWLSPDGELARCKSWAHTSVAENIAKQLGIYDERVHSDEALIAHGWIRIKWLSFMDSGLSFSRWGKREATQPQKSFLRQLYEDRESDISETGFYELWWLGVIEKDEYEKSTGEDK